MEAQLPGLRGLNMGILVVFIVTLAAFLLVIVGMAVGVILGRREISGSCGGLANQNPEGGESSCSLCSNPDSACKELRDRMQGKPAETECEGGDCSGSAHCDETNATSYT